MAKRNEELACEHEAVRSAHEKLKAEQEQWIEAAKEAANHRHAGVSQMLTSIPDIVPRHLSIHVESNSKAFWPPALPHLNSG